MLSSTVRLWESNYLIHFLVICPCLIYSLLLSAHAGMNVYLCLSLLVCAVRDIASMWLWWCYPTRECVFLFKALLLWKPDLREVLVISVIRCERKSPIKILVHCVSCLALCYTHLHSARVLIHIQTLAQTREHSPVNMWREHCLSTRTEYSQ